MLNTLINIAGRLGTRTKNISEESETNLQQTQTDLGHTDTFGETSTANDAIERPQSKTVVGECAINDFLKENFDLTGYEIGHEYGNKDLLDLKVQECISRFKEACRIEIEKLDEQIQIKLEHLTKMGDYMPTTKELVQNQLGNLKMKKEDLESEIQAADQKSGRISGCIYKLQSGFQKGLEKHIRNQDLLSKFDNR